VSVGAQATRAAGWSFLGFGASQVVRLAGNLVLTRLLFAEAFGLLAIASVLLQGLTLFSDLGIGPSIIQNRRGDDRDFLNTAFTLQAARGLLLSLFAAALAWPFAAFYEEPRLLAIVPVVGITALLQGLNSTKVFTVGRALDLKRLTIVELASQLLAVAVMVAWALVSPTVWALVAGALAAASIKMALSHAVLRGPVDRLQWHRPSAGSLLGFGKWIFVSTIMAFFASQSDRLIFGKLVPLDAFGIYSIGAMLAVMPQLAFFQIEQRVVFPVYSRVYLAGDDLGRIFPRVRAGFLTAGGYTVAVLIAGGPLLVDLLYDDRYLQAGWVVQYLSVGTWLGLLQSTHGAALLAMGRARWVAAASFAKVVGIAAFVATGWELGGFPGAVAGYALSELLRYLALTLAGRQHGLRDLRQDFLLSVAVAGSAFAGPFAADLARAAGVGVAGQTAALLALVSLLWLPLAYPHLKGTLERLGATRAS
jgi:O-antigen/teichoic acid export membrane protein